MNKHIKIHMLTNFHDNGLNSKTLGLILWNPKVRKTTKTIILIKSLIFMLQSWVKKQFVANYLFYNFYFENFSVSMILKTSLAKNQIWGDRTPKKGGEIDF